MLLNQGYKKRHALPRTDSSAEHLEIITRLLAHPHTLKIEGSTSPMTSQLCYHAASLIHSRPLSLSPLWTQLPTQQIYQFSALLTTPLHFHFPYQWKLKNHIATILLPFHTITYIGIKNCVCILQTDHYTSDNKYRAPSENQNLYLKVMVNQISSVHIILHQDAHFIYC